MKLTTQLDLQSLYFCIDPSCKVTSRYLISMKDIAQHNGHNFITFEELKNTCASNIQDTKNEIREVYLMKIIKELEQFLKETKKQLEKQKQVRELQHKAIEALQNLDFMFIHNEELKIALQNLKMRNYFNCDDFITSLESRIKFFYPNWSQDEKHTSIQGNLLIATKVYNNVDYPCFACLNPRFKTQEMSLEIRLKLNQCIDDDWGIGFMNATKRTNWINPFQWDETHDGIFCINQDGSRSLINDPIFKEFMRMEQAPQELTLE